LFDSGTMTTGAVRIPRSHASGSAAALGGVQAVQKRSTSSGVSSSRNAQPWLNPALGACSAFARMRSTVGVSTGRSA
jgi:hypothetical protein